MNQLIEFDEYITPDGRVYELHNGVNRFLMSGIGGQGLPSISYRTERGPNQHGNTVVGYVLEPRILQMVHRRVGRDRYDFWELRQDLINHMRPNRQTSGSLLPGVLRKYLPDQSIRDIAVFIQDTAQFAGLVDRWDEHSWTEPLRFIAPDPTFYDPVEQSLTFVGSPPTNQLVFPIGFPIIFGQAGYLSQSGSVTYTGTWPAYPEIVITGPINNPRIENLTTGEKIELTYNVPTGVSITIDLTGGDKTVIDTLGNDLIGTVTTDSDLATFHLAPDPEAADGVNYLAGYGTMALITSTIVIRWNIRDIGI